MSQTVLITGASTGIGRATALHFHNQGWNVVATMRSPDQENELTELDNVLVTRLDVLDGASINDAVAATLDRFGSIDALVNNAGYGAFGPVEAFSMEGIERQFDTNVIGLLAVTKAVLPPMREQRSGVIANVSSIGGRMTFPLGSLYHGTKFAVEGITESMTFEMAPLGVKMKLIEPGAIRTDFGGRSFDFQNDESLTGYQDVVASVMSVMGSIGDQASEPSLVAEVIWNAVTDGTDQLRYTAGPDAEMLMANRKVQDDATFQAGVLEQFGFTR